LILFLSAPAVAGFFNSPQASLVIRVIAVSTLLSGLRNIGIIFFQKDLQFNKQFTFEFSATLADLAVAVILAFILRNVWALVWGGLAANFVRLLMSYILHSYHPKIRFNKQKFYDLFGFGKWLLGSSILIFLITQGDDIFVGKILGVTALGLYQMAYLISNLPATEITHVISQVTFPAYSKLQDDLPKLKEAYLRVFQLTAFISIPLAAGIFVLSREFTEVLLGQKWTLMVPAMQVLALWGAIRALGATTGPVFHATGNPKILTKLQFSALTILFFLIFPFTVQWGIFGTSLAVVTSTLIPNIAAAYMVSKAIQCIGLEVFRGMLPALLNTAIMVLFIYTLKTFLITIEGVSELVFLVIIAVLVYCVATYICNKLFGIYEEVFEIFLKRS
jgi:O-antigen/teichoic acid export membrane protein